VLLRTLAHHEYLILRVLELLIEVLVVSLTPSGLLVSCGALLLAKVSLVALLHMGGYTGTVGALLLLINLEIRRQHSHGVLFG
jgi:hypothetical protein